MVKVDDKYNPDFVLACTHTEMLKAIAAGDVDVKELAVKELIKRNPNLSISEIENLITETYPI